MNVLPSFSRHTLKLLSKCCILKYVSIVAFSPTRCLYSYRMILRVCDKLLYHIHGPFCFIAYQMADPDGGRRQDPNTPSRSHVDIYWYFLRNCGMNPLEKQ